MVKYIHVSEINSTSISEGDKGVRDLCKYERMYP